MWIKDINGCVVRASIVLSEHLKRNTKEQSCNEELLGAIQRIPKKTIFLVYFVGFKDCYYKNIQFENGKHYIYIYIYIYI